MSYKRLLQVIGEVLIVAHIFNDGDFDKIEVLKGMVKILNIMDVYLTWNMDSTEHIEWVKVEWKSFVEIFEI